MKINTINACPCGKPTEQPDEEPRIRQLEIFLEKMHEALRGKKILDFDTNWRMTEQVMPPSLECLHAKDSAEISGSYRKIHLSDILSATRELIGLYWKRKPKRESVAPVYDDEFIRDIAWQIEAGLESEENYHQVADRLTKRFDIRRRRG